MGFIMKILNVLCPPLQAVLYTFLQTNGFFFEYEQQVETSIHKSHIPTTTTTKSTIIQEIIIFSLVL